MRAKQRRAACWYFQMALKRVCGLQVGRAGGTSVDEPAIFHLQNQPFALKLPLQLWKAQTNAR